MSCVRLCKVVQREFTQLKYGKIFGIKRKEEIFCETDIGCVK